MTNQRLRTALKGAVKLIETVEWNGFSVADRKVLDEARAALATDEPPADSIYVRGVIYDRSGWVCSVCHGWNHGVDQLCVHSHSALNRSGE